MILSGITERILDVNKTFVVDTNVLLHNAESITSFGDNTVVLPMPVIEELDKFKSHNDELGRNARSPATPRRRICPISSLTSM